MIGGWIAAGLARLGLRPSPGLARGTARVLQDPGAGTETWMVEIGSDGRYRGMRNVLVEECFAGLEPGETIDEVRRRLGRPLATADFPARRERVLSWKYRADGGRLEHFNAHFDEGGRLTGVSRTPDPESINAQ
jgi:hypothetical protein